MKTSGIENALAQALKNLSAEWQEARLHWRDVKAVEFDKTYFEPLPHHVAKAVAAIADLTALLRQVRHDCE